MNRLGRPVEKEWFRLVTLNEFDHVVAVIIGQPLGLTRFVDTEVFRALLGRIFLGGLLSNFREANLQRPLLLGPDVPLADLSGDVTVVSHESRQGGPVLRNGETTGHAVFAKALPILTHDQTTSTRATRRIGNIGSGEANAFGSQAIDIGRGNILAVITPEIPVSQVVDVDEHNVGLFGCQRHPTRQQKKGDGQRA